MSQITDDRLNSTQTGKVTPLFIFNALNYPRSGLATRVRSNASAGTSLILGTADPLPLGLAILGSQLPDLDTTTSTIGKIFFSISSWIEDRFPHRTITHSLLATAAIAVVSLSVNYFWLQGDIKVAIALPLGHLLACFSDTFTKQGVQLFYPDPAWAISVSNP